MPERPLEPHCYNPYTGALEEDEYLQREVGEYRVLMDPTFGEVYPRWPVAVVTHPELIRVAPVHIDDIMVPDPEVRPVRIERREEGAQVR